jgi:hypothetical protein
MYLYSLHIMFPNLMEQINVFPITECMNWGSVVLRYRKNRPIPNYMADFINMIEESFSQYNALGHWALPSGVLG